MNEAIPAHYEGVSVATKANVYFDGKVISHTVLFKGGARKTLGLIFPGTYSFNTADPERMDITAGSCRYRIAGQKDWSRCDAPGHFDVPANSSFELAVDGGVTEYVCSFG